MRGDVEMTFYRKSFEIDSNSDPAEQKKVLLMIGCLFAFIGGIFMLVGCFTAMTTDSADNYSKTGEYPFTYVQTNRDTRTSRTRTSGPTRSTTSTYYIPMYVGDVVGESYTYDYHKEFSTEKDAKNFANSNQALLVSTYRDDDNKIFFLASDITLEEYFQKRSYLG